MSLRSITLGSLILLLGLSLSCKSMKYYGSSFLIKNAIKGSKQWEKLKGFYSLDKKSDLKHIILKFGVRNSSLETKKFVLLIAELNDTLEKTMSSAILLSRCSFLTADSSIKKSDIKRYSKKAVEAFNGMNWQNSPEASYYYALGLGAVMRMEGLAAIMKLPTVIKAMKAALKKPDTDFYGPHRIYGMLYLKAPKWPKGIGDVDEALKHLKISMKKYPEFPQNTFFYAEALIEDDQMNEARKYLNISLQNLEKRKWGPFYNRLWKSEIKKLQQKTLD
jgi:tetratricopeptide (TPR) repeat protein